MIDGFSLECLAIVVKPRICSREVIKVLDFFFKEEHHLMYTQIMVAASFLMENSEMSC